MRTRYSVEFRDHLIMNEIDGWFNWAELDELCRLHPSRDQWSIRNELVFRLIRKNTFRNVWKSISQRKECLHRLMKQSSAGINLLKNRAQQLQAALKKKASKENKKDKNRKTKKKRSGRARRDEIETRKLFEDLILHQKREKERKKKREEKQKQKQKKEKAVRDVHVKIKDSKNNVGSIDNATEVDINHKESQEVLDLLVRSKKEELENPDRETKTEYWQGMCLVIHRSCMINGGCDPDVYDKVAKDESKSTLIRAVDFYEELIRRNLAGKIVELIGKVEKKGLFKKHPPSETPLVFASFQRSSIDFLPTVGYLIPFKDMAASGLVPPDPSKIHIPEGKLVAYGMHWSFKVEYNLFGAFYRVSPTRINYFWVIYDRLDDKWWHNTLVFKQDE